MGDNKAEQSSGQGGFPYAIAINAWGCNAFALRYRPGIGERAATEDLAAALSAVFRHAGALGVGTAGYPNWGHSIERAELHGW